MFSIEAVAKPQWSFIPMISQVMAVLRAGGVYVPIDLSKPTPDDYVRKIIDEIKPPMIMIQSCFKSRST